MRNKIVGMIAAVVIAVPATAMAQRTQLLPDEVKEVRIDGHHSLHVRQGEENSLFTASQKNNIATVRGDRMKIDAGDYEVVLTLAPGRSISIHAEDYATIEFSGSFGLRDHLTVETEDYATARFLGTTADTVQVIMLTMKSEDFSRITSDVIIRHLEYDLDASDYSRIELAGIDQMPNPNDQGISLRSSISDFGKIYTGRITDQGELVNTNYARDDRDYTTVINSMTDRLAGAVRNEAEGKQQKRKRSSWHSGDFNLDFGWGWHNWGSEMLTGFGGAEGAAEVSTSFNNIHLAGRYELVGNRWLGFYAGLGLEWDKWKFTAPNVEFGTATSPYTFAEATPANGSTLLTTRYVNVPLSIRIGDDDGFHLMLTALPGIHWNASGLRHKVKDANHTSTTKDRSVNSHINPYKLDVRAELWYNTIGLYVQMSTLSMFRTGCEELYPVKFGIIL